MPVVVQVTEFSEHYINTLQKSYHDAFRKDLHHLHYDKLFTEHSPVNIQSACSILKLLCRSLNTFAPIASDKSQCCHCAVFTMIYFIIEWAKHLQDWSTRPSRKIKFYLKFYTEQEKNCIYVILNALQFNNSK